MIRKWSNIVEKNIWIIFFIFLFSRVLAYVFNVDFDYSPIYKYWQYLDINTLRNNLIDGVWYNHAQPPFFNLLLGIILKLFGNHAIFVFSFLLKIISLSNAILLYNLLKKIEINRNIALIISVFYLISPASIILETELYYTTLISFLLLVGFTNLLKLNNEIRWSNLIGFFLPILLICLTRSMYHLIWLTGVSIIVILFNKKRKEVKKLYIIASLSLIILGGWYLKNYMIFGTFSTSSWMGMNLSRNVFHDNESTDSSRIEAYKPFSSISTYQSFIEKEDEYKYRGLNNRDLLSEFKNDSFINLNHIAYIEISKKYLIASKNHIFKHPTSYTKNVIQSGFLYFAPATTYSLIRNQVQKIRIYDAIFSFNLTCLAKTKSERRITLLISAIPRIILYLYIFFILFRDWIQKRQIRLFNTLIVFTISYIFILGSLLEHYENMRFRFEIEPLFLLMLGQVIQKKYNSKNPS